MRAWEAEEKTRDRTGKAITLWRPRGVIPIKLLHKRFFCKEAYRLSN